METVGLGLRFEDLPVGRKFRTVGRTVTETDIVNFCNCTGNTGVILTNLALVYTPLRMIRCRNGGAE